MNRELAHALQDRRQSIERIIRKLEAPDGSDKPNTELIDSPQLSIDHILSSITSFVGVVEWAKGNFEPSDVLLLETKFKKKLNLHAERVEDPNYCRLITLVFYLMASNQCAKVYGDFSHRAISAALSTHLDMYHSLHLLEIACFLADMVVQSCVRKARIAEALDTLQDFPLTPQQEITLAKLCLMPEHGQAFRPLYFAKECDKNETSGATKPDAQAGADLVAILEAVNNPEKGHSILTQRHNLLLETEVNGDDQRKKCSAPYYAPNLALCLQLRKVLTLGDIKKSAASALLDKLTALWEILLPMHINLGEMTDFQ